MQENRPWAKPSSLSGYKKAIHDAVNAAGETDAYTGDMVEWKLINTWGLKKGITGENLERDFALMPTVDHIDPEADALEIETCSWFVNGPKGRLSCADHIALCRRVASRFPKTGSTDTL